MRDPRSSAACLVALILIGTQAHASGPQTDHALRQRLRMHLQSIAAIDTHDHLRPFDLLAASGTSDQHPGIGFVDLLNGAYVRALAPIPPRTTDEPIAQWWQKSSQAFADVRATGFYQCLRLGLRDLYGVELNSLSSAEAAALDERILRNYQDERWTSEVITKRANIELMLIDPYWGRLSLPSGYSFSVPVLNVSMLLNGHHPTSFPATTDENPYAIAESMGLVVKSLDDYLAAVERLFQIARERGAVSVKTIRAYDRPLLFENVTKERAAQIFGHPASALAPQDIRAFQDFMMWRLVELSAKYDLPFQIHTGHGRLQGSNPLLLLDLIQQNPKTKFVLFHGGYPWIGETGAIGLRHWNNVWIDIVWLPTISPTMARRALHEWLETVPSNRILWGGDSNHPETIYASAALVRDVIADVLAEKVVREEIDEPEAMRIGRQILRDNALALFPTLERRLWKDR